MQTFNNYTTTKFYLVLNTFIATYPNCLSEVLWTIRVFKGVCPNKHYIEGNPTGPYICNL